MAKNPIEKEIEKQRKEAQRIAEQERITQTASTIASGQPIIGDMRIMEESSEEILSILLSNYDDNPERIVKGNDRTLPEAYYSSLKLELEKLKMYGVISNYVVWINAVWEITLTPQGISYFKRKEIALEKERESQKAQVHIDNLVANGGNVVLGDMINSSVSIDNSIKKIENEIEEKGGEDSEELKNLLEEVRELIENIDDSRHIPKNKSLFSRISNHFSKHGWFYAEVVALLGAEAIKLMQG